MSSPAQVGSAHLECALDDQTETSGDRSRGWDSSDSEGEDPPAIAELSPKKNEKRATKSMTTRISRQSRHWRFCCCYCCCCFGDHSAQHRPRLRLPRRDAATPCPQGAEPRHDAQRVFRSHFLLLLLLLLLLLPLGSLQCSSVPVLPPPQKSGGGRRFVLVLGQPPTVPRPARTRPPCAPPSRPPNLTRQSTPFQGTAPPPIVRLHRRGGPTSTHPPRYPVEATRDVRPIAAPATSPSTRRRTNSG